LYPLSDLVFQSSGDIEGYGFPFFFPGDIEDRVFGSSVMAGAIFFPQKREVETREPSIQG